MLVYIFISPISCSFLFDLEERIKQRNRTDFATASHSAPLTLKNSFEKICDLMTDIFIVFFVKYYDRFFY